MDTFDWLKDRIKKPRVVVDLGMVNELRGIKDAGGGLEIGAMTTLTTIANDPMVKERFPLLAAGGADRRLAADSQPGHARRQRVAGRALLVLPRRLAVLSRRRQHLLRRHADRRSTASTRSSMPIAAWR